MAIPHSPNMTICAKKTTTCRGNNDPSNRRGAKTYPSLLDRESRDTERTHRHRKRTNQTSHTKSILYNNNEIRSEEKKRAEIQRKKENIGNNKDGRKLLREAIPTSQPQKDIAHRKRKMHKITTTKPSGNKEPHAVQTHKRQDPKYYRNARLKHFKAPKTNVREKKVSLKTVRR